jgi:4-hydroxybenzoate polyprenyltransferase
MGEMFPPAVQVPGGIAAFAALYFTLQALGGADTLELPWRAYAGAATVVLITLLLRVYDELKDVEVDQRLGKAGDPRYQDRAIVTGHILPEDLVALRWWVTALIIAINLPLGVPYPLLAFALLFGVTWLSFKWFFWPAVSKNLLLAFITHNPMTLLVFGYVLALYVHDFGAGGLTLDALWLALAFWLPMAAWETSRKVRRPEDETDYQTYSKLLGWRVAGILPALFGAGAAASMIAVARVAGLSPIFMAIVAVAAAVFVAACLRFLLRPSTAAANLKPYSELYMIVSTVGLMIAGLLEYGLRFGGTG